uniref:Uncharacterized protein n=1 Tax=Mucochytrium quahogii TaxID=96639 RepID=A0A7S2S5U7_9STRA|mmetsp:Transcript_11069/g.18120  ORF Transcript_11069/g.18120 Transcript_11069/m.18120 type:complete len:397 (-) Transcript_11069:45-1235(-)
MMFNVKRLDAFPKTLDEFRVRTSSGGLVSLVGILLILICFSWELAEFMQPRATEDVVVDNTMHDKLIIHFDITFPKTQCSVIAIAAVDAAGEKQSMKAHSVYKLPLDDKLRAFPSVVKQDAESKAILTKDELSKHKEKVSDDVGDHQPEDSHDKDCPTCYGLQHEKESTNKCCHTCAEVQAAFLERGWEWDPNRINRFWQCSNGVALTSEKSVGCEVFGTIAVTKAKGSFHFGLTDLSSGFGGLFQLFNRDSHVDISHRIHKLWFGTTNPVDGEKALHGIDSSVGVYKPPLEDLERHLDEPSTVDYYIKVIPIDVVRKDGTVLHFNRYSATEHSRRITSMSLPSLHIRYDEPPLRLQFIEYHKPWTHFATSVCALTGGVFAVMGIVDSFLYSRSRK